MKPVRIERLYRAWFEGIDIPIEVLQTPERGYSGFDDETWLDMYQFAVTSCHLPTGACVLDAGCGSGYGADLLCSLGYKVTAIDAADDAVKYSQMRAPTATVLKRSMDALDDLGASTFDAIVAIETVEHVQEDEKMFAGFLKLLKPGGVLFLSTPDRTLFDQSHVVAHPDAGPRVINPFHVREYTEIELFELLKHSGFYHIVRMRSLLSVYHMALAVICWKPNI